MIKPLCSRCPISKFCWLEQDWQLKGKLLNWRPSQVFSIFLFFAVFQIFNCLGSLTPGFLQKWKNPKFVLAVCRGPGKLHPHNLHTKNIHLWLVQFSWTSKMPRLLQYPSKEGSRECRRWQSTNYSKNTALHRLWSKSPLITQALWEGHPDEGMLALASPSAARSPLLWSSLAQWGFKMGCAVLILMALDTFVV